MRHENYVTNRATNLYGSQGNQCKHYIVIMILLSNRFQAITSGYDFNKTTFSFGDTVACFKSRLFS